MVVEQLNRMSDAKASGTKTSFPADEAAPKPRFYSFDNIKSLLVLVLAILALRWSVASPYHVPTASMEPTMGAGQSIPTISLIVLPL